ncbi:TIGR03915 family putative DNA repair protein [Thermospira aquatica]|uniref:TIGR03915 family putative DNA repair protein n=1 Tax=Thermospira aquatica TaxID=2828656 RepID=A0AAX3BEG1_9SPIR|nr:TIGR03915 family putative DNA repair protein [Thermospira aquatica]URA10697.1 TIGR03915 family putative DNA repair protein [Thermospira aquatica]
MITHDGSFTAFFTAFLVALSRGEDFGPEEGGLFETKSVSPDDRLVEQWLARTKQAYGSEVVSDFLALFFSEEKDRESLFLSYAKLLEKKGKTIRNARQEPIIARIMKIRRAYFFEVHRFQGLVRFREIQGWLYAPIEPTYHILPYLWSHFHRRLPREKWIIHDTGRDVAVLYDGEIHWTNGFSLDGTLEELVSEREKEIQALWKGFYQSIAIPERKNPRQQRQMMPKKYWKYLVEKENNPA